MDIGYSYFTFEVGFRGMFLVACSVTQLKNHSLVRWFTPPCKHRPAIKPKPVISTGSMTGFLLSKRFFISRLLSLSKHKADRREPFSKRFPSILSPTKIAKTPNLRKDKQGSPPPNTLDDNQLPVLPKNSLAS
ncbi:MAG TPA: hypothetical protein ENG82_00695 [Bacteroidetes bacterium]|nr:hypothetical protein [Bacteroidota bacterium]